MPDARIEMQFQPRIRTAYRSFSQSVECVVAGDGVTLDVLGPSLPFLSDTGDDVNENSIVVMLHYLDFRELFMGDAGEASEGRLLAATAPFIPSAVEGQPQSLHAAIFTRTSGSDQFMFRN